MSFNILVVTEDYRRDEHVLRPILQKLARELRSNPKVQILTDPLLGGVSEALKWERIEEILDRYQKRTDCFLLIVDRDGDAGRRDSLDYLESKAAAVLGENRLIAEQAWQEIEVWVLAGMKDLPTKWKWSEIQSEPNAKEVYFLPYAEKRGFGGSPHEGRIPLGKEAAAQYSKRIRKLCPEVQTLEDRLRAAFG